MGTPLLLLNLWTVFSSVGMASRATSAWHSAVYQHVEMFVVVDFGNLGHASGRDQTQHVYMLGERADMSKKAEASC